MKRRIMTMTRVRKKLKFLFNSSNSINLNQIILGFWGLYILNHDLRFLFARCHTP